ncbi:uncharacterized protein BO97DRAFT_2056 [Aspergillus homomorphus CBS 101889]|uniref:Uncharacterized protein n=1 Tax=Aspergillus homomorphus (strain CBS 101889) TaxID=1450537 RepID=A0A395IDI8_ASPHC|nr:hypothetical protein BO97DRAFT_2056 [Aspergillus homomorphus CBS 101889]RAL17208.1 hypothetical protein BO97DRAFT_2056 [Aspergillus homomorphus CBS 101889]
MMNVIVSGEAVGWFPRSLILSSPTHLPTYYATIYLLQYHNPVIPPPPPHTSHRITLHSLTHAHTPRRNARAIKQRQERRGGRRVGTNQKQNSKPSYCSSLLQQRPAPTIPNNDLSNRTIVYAPQNCGSSDNNNHRKLLGCLVTR